MLKLTLNEAEKALIYRTKRSERGKGGFQSFMVHLQDKMNSSEAGELDLTGAEIGQIARYAAYDNGGFEGRLREAFGRHLPKLFPGHTQNLFANVQPLPFTFTHDGLSKSLKNED